MGNPLDTRGTKNAKPTPDSRGVDSGYTTAPEQEKKKELQKLEVAKTVVGGEPWSIGIAHDLIINTPNRQNWDGLYPSFELQGPDPKTKIPEDAVYFWLRWKAASIVRTETKSRVDRRAIAGVIAWEALKNPSGQRTILTSSGPGKIHLTRTRDDLSWPEVVEAVNKMPRLPEFDRKIKLADPDLAISYIGAIFDVCSEIAEHYGWDIRHCPELLALIFHSRTMNEWLRDIKNKPHGALFQMPPGTMGEWVKSNNAYLVSAVGSPSI